jgi:TRAP transporter TAXI family solute receptor
MMETGSLLSRRGLFALGAGALLGPSIRPCAQERDAARFFRIGTGGIAGTYFPIGTLIADALNDATLDEPCAKHPCSLDGRFAVAQLSSGSVANCAALRAGSIDAGLVQSDILYSGWKGVGGFAAIGPFPDLRFAATLYPEALHIVVAEDSNIYTLRDIIGRRIAIDENGSGALALVLAALSALGIKETDFRPQYIKPDIAAERMSSGRLDGFTAVDAVPSVLVATVLARNRARLISILPTDAAIIRRTYPYLETTVIPAGSYAGQPELPTLRVMAQLAVTTRLDGDAVHEMLRRLWSESSLARLRGGHPRGGEVNLADALAGAEIPLHEGAQRFYREIGALK